MDNFLPYEMSIETIQKSINKEFKHFFKDKIKGSFLINIKSRVLKELGCELQNYYDFSWTGENLVTGKDDLPEYDICRFIIGIHHSHSIFISNDVIREKERDSKYQESLTWEVIEKIKLRRYGSLFFRKNLIHKREEFLFYPVPYELFILCNRTYELLLNSNINITRLQLYYGIMSNALAALSLMENNFLGSAYPLCRGVIEIYLKLKILKENLNAVEQYERFRKFEVEQSCCHQEYPKEFNVLFERRTNKQSHNKVNYLHYGWLDSVEEYHNRVKQSPYSMNGIITFLKTSVNEKQRLELDCIERLYKMCHGYTHGSVQIAKYPLLHYFEISIMLYHTIRNTFISFCDEQNVEATINGLDVIAMMDRDFAELSEQYKKRSTENFEAQQKMI